MVEHETCRRVRCQTEFRRRKERKEGGGERGIRTLGRALRPYGGLANRWFQPLTHLSELKNVHGKASRPPTQFQLQVRSLRSLCHEGRPGRLPAGCTYRGHGGRVAGDMVDTSNEPEQSREGRLQWGGARCRSCRNVESS
jgi:hypothetical protein